jgi:aryl-alcohol dehydrogenase
MQTDAAVLRDPTGRFSIEQVCLEEPGPGELLVRVVGAGLCHTDLLARSMPAGHYALPMIFGH